MSLPLYYFIYFSLTSACVSIHTVLKLCPDFANKRVQNYQGETDETANSSQLESVMIYLKTAPLQQIF